MAALIRRINQEATPLEERTFLVAMSNETAGDSAYATEYTERSSGNEETVESREVVAAVLLGRSKQLAIGLARDFGEDTAYSLLEPGADNRWKLRWTSPRRRC